MKKCNKLIIYEESGKFPDSDIIELYGTGEGCEEIYTITMIDTPAYDGEHWIYRCKLTPKENEVD